VWGRRPVGRSIPRRSSSPATRWRQERTISRRIGIEKLNDGLEANSVLRQSDLTVDATKERVDIVENHLCDFVEVVRPDDVGMCDVELSEVVEQVSFSEVVLVRCFEQPTEKVVAR